MAWGKTWTLTTLLLTGALAGCVQALPEERPEPPQCDDCCFDADCCVDCGCWGARCATPTPTPLRPSRGWIAPTPSVCPALEANMTFTSCAPPQPPLFEPFGIRAVRECSSCGEVALLVEGDRIYLATSEGLDIVTPTRTLAAAAPIPDTPPTGWTLRSPALASDGVDVWYAALARADMGILPPYDALIVARWDGGAGWTREQLVPLEALPEATPATRVLLAAARDGVVALLETDAGAWSVRVADAAPTPQPVGEPGSRLRFGTPARDAEGRARVPFAREPPAPLEGGMPTPGLATLPDVSSAWSLQDVGEGAWSVRGAVPAVETFPEGPDLALTWLDDVGSVVRARSWDGGATWDDSTRWRDAGHATSPPAAAQDGDRATLAWNEDDRVLLARGMYGPEGTMEMPRETRSAPALAMMGTRAVVAWLSPEGGLVLAREGTWDPECDDAAHCRGGYH